MHHVSGYGGTKKRWISGSDNFDLLGMISSAVSSEMVALEIGRIINIFDELFLLSKLILVTTSKIISCSFAISPRPRLQREAKFSACTVTDILTSRDN
jgi:hypothetical protein